MSADETDEPLTEAELLSAGWLEESIAAPLLVDEAAERAAHAGGQVAEAAGSTSGDGPFAADGTVRLAIIRPCISRGARLRGMRPIYTPQMLAEAAPMFGGWQMFIDHALREALEEALAEAELAEAGRRPGAAGGGQRSVHDLGGRIVRSWWVPDLVLEGDAEAGYQPGGVVGDALPRRMVREMVEDDPDLLNVSIKAWPKAGRPAAVPWNPSQRGMLLEGLRTVPQGSVDWVPRGGAGGRVLTTATKKVARRRTGTPAREGYDAPRHATTARNGDGDDMPKWSEMTLEELQEGQRERPDLFGSLGAVAEGARSGGGQDGAGDGSGLSRADLDRALHEQREEADGDRDEAIAKAVREAREEWDSDRRDLRAAERRRDAAHAVIREAALPSGFQADLLRRYRIDDDGPSAALLVEAEEGKTEDEAVLEQARADVRHVQQRVAEAAGYPVVRGMGGQDRPDGARGGASKGEGWREHFVAEGEDGKTVALEGDELTEALVESFQGGMG